MNRTTLLCIFIAELSFLSNGSAESLSSKVNGQERPPDILEVDGIRYYYENGMIVKEDEGKSLNRHAIEYAKQGRIPEAISYAKRALELSEKTYGKVHRNVAADFLVLANLYVAQGDYFNAEPMIQRAITIDSEIFGANDPEVGVDFIVLGSLHETKRDTKNAEESYNKALKLLSTTQNPKYAEHIAVCHRNLGQLKLEQKDFINSLAHLKSAADLYEQINPSVAVEVLNKIAAIYLERGDHLNVEKTLSHVKSIRQD